jgi:protein required for attachment to host cells
VADGEHARVVAPVEAVGHFATRIAFDPASARLHADAAAGAVALHTEVAAPGRTAQHPTHDPKVQGERGFAVSVARHLDAHALNHDFDQLVLVAPGRTLHHLRAALGPQATAMVVGSATHDYVKLADHDLSPHLAQWWLAPPVG